MINTLRVLVIGAGWLGLPLAEALRNAGHSVQVSNRSGASASFTTAGLQAMALDLDEELPDLTAFEVVIASFPPAARAGNDALYAQRLQRLCQALSPKVRFLLVSSTGVYPQAAGVYTEVSTTLAEHAVRQGEEVVLKHFPEALVLRAGGLAGYDRIIGRYFSGRELVDPTQVVNLIHRDDVVGAALHLMAVGAQGCYNLVAPEHPSKAAVYAADLEALQLTPFLTAANPAIEAPRIISSNKLLSTGYRFEHPNPLYFPREFDLRM
jgi:nucleoside-diphosphate-sugar epimerase